jgi:branched-chain amino acid transport system ATP-binding protein
VALRLHRDTEAAAAAVSSGRNEILLGQDIAVTFEGLQAIGGVTLPVHRGEIRGLIGPNGAGKTTFVNVLTGFQAPTKGSIVLDGEDLTGWRPEEFASKGIARTFQNVRLYRGLSIRENLEINAIAAGCTMRQSRERAAELLDWVGLSRRSDDGADILPYGEERRVGIIRALAGSPRFLLLDEPAAGMNESECEALLALILAIPKRYGCGVLLIEHNMRVVMSSCAHIYVIDFGLKIAEGTPQEIQGNSDVKQAYLGWDHAHGTPHP